MKVQRIKLTKGGETIEVADLTAGELVRDGDATYVADEPTKAPRKTAKKAADNEPTEVEQ